MLNYCLKILLEIENLHFHLEFFQDEMNCQQYNATEVDLFLNSNASNSISDKKFLRNLKLISCQIGWIYDNSVYIDTLVTEVFFTSYK